MPTLTPLPTFTSSPVCSEELVCGEHVFVGDGMAAAGTDSQTLSLLAADVLTLEGAAEDSSGIRLETHSEDMLTLGELS